MPIANTSVCIQQFAANKFDGRIKTIVERVLRVTFNNCTQMCSLKMLRIKIKYIIKYITEKIETMVFLEIPMILIIYINKKYDKKCNQNNI